MGILTDFVIAKATDAEAVGNSGWPGDAWPTLEAKGVGIVELVKLYCAATGDAFRSEMFSSFQLVGDEREEGPWVFQIPSDILETLASIADDDMATVAIKWVEAEELQIAGWVATDAAEFIELFRSHARRALAEKSSLFLWMSL